MENTAQAPDEQVSRLLNADDATFVRDAYQLILGRGADHEGEALYVQRLAAGAKRRDVLAELAASDEGREQLAGKPDLAAALSRRTGGSGSVAASVDVLLALPDTEFVEHSVRLVIEQGADLETHGLLLAQLRGGRPRFRILQDLAQTSGRSSFTEIQGLDALLESARDPLFPRARSVNELLQYHDEAFVDCAYKTLLARAPDFAGMAFYLDRLRRGHSRSSVLCGMATSSEARVRKATVQGLASFIGRYRRANVPGLRALMGWVSGAETDSPRDRRRRMLQQLLMRNHALESQLRTAGAGGTPTIAQTGLRGAQQAVSLKSLETALMARHEALVDIQRDSFDRELNALRKLVSRLLDEAPRGRASAPRRANGRPALRRQP